jgi:L-aminopeptidase/D-esterase-like protein
MLSGMSANFVDMGNGNSKATIGIDVPNDITFRGAYYVMGLVVDQSNFTLLGITGDPVRFQLRRDTTQEEADLRELQNQLQISIADQRIVATQIQRLKRRLITSFSKSAKIITKIRASKTKLKIIKNKISTLSEEITEMEDIIKQG